MINIMKGYIDNEKNPIESIMAFEKMSEKYRLVSSQDISNKILDSGFNLVGTSNTRPRKEEKRGFQKHLMVFDREDLRIDQDNKLQLLVTNSHDGTTPLTINIGIYRQICANGLVVGNSLFETKLRHLGKDLFINVEKSLEEFTRVMPLVAEKVELMRQVKLERDTQLELARLAAHSRLTEDNIKSIDYNSLLTIRRFGDSENDLFTTMNRIQESVIRGGIKYQATNEKGQLRDLTSRRLNSISKVMTLNKTIWDESTKLLAA